MPLPVRLALLFLLVAGCLLKAQPRRITPAGQPQRVALVVGNDQYSKLPRLSNSANDARDMAAALRQLGFSVIEREDATREVFDTAAEEFVRRIRPGDIVLFYYSGHGMQISGENYLAPIDLTAENEAQARNRAIRAGEVLAEMESGGASLNMLILDACRDNPFGGKRSIGGQGLAAMNPGKGTLIAYATAPGSTADDNRQGKNGLYTSYLLQALNVPGWALEEVFRNTGAKVSAASGGRQIPWITSSYGGDFYFRPVAPPVVPASPSDAEEWEAIRSSTSAEVFQGFIAKYPDSQYAGAARLKLASSLEPGLASGRGATTSPIGPATLEPSEPPRKPTAIPDKSSGTRQITAPASVHYRNSFTGGAGYCDGLVRFSGGVVAFASQDASNRCRKMEFEVARGQISGFGESRTGCLILNIAGRGNFELCGLLPDKLKSLVDSLEASRPAARGH
jgi:uncharacterized caspase-like protein